MIINFDRKNTEYEKVQKETEKCNLTNLFRLIFHDLISETLTHPHRCWTFSCEFSVFLCGIQRIQYF